MVEEIVTLIDNEDDTRSVEKYRWLLVEEVVI